MVKVYIVQRCYRYEGESVLDVFADEQKAIEFAKEIIGQSNPIDKLTIKTFEKEDPFDHKVTYLEYDDKSTFYLVEEWEVK